jgi:hypothetical protein
MKKAKVYVSPSASRKDKNRRNPYIDRLKAGLSGFCDVYEMDGRPCLMQSTALFRHALKADVFMLNFLETVAFHKLPHLQTLLTLLSLRIIVARRKTIVFFFHNPVPHQGNNRMSRRLIKELFACASYAVAHSEEAARIASEKLGKDKVLYFHHPTEELKEVEPMVDDTDVLIWGKILPYKGIPEFLSLDGLSESGLNVRIIGACPDPELADRIRALSIGKVTFEQRWPSMEELGSRIAGSRFVLMPYLPGSISGSAALMDTLKFGGNAVGPNVGAFSELSKLGLCKVYSNHKELFDILESDWKVDKPKLKQFLDRYSWPEYIRTLDALIPELRNRV